MAGKHLVDDTKEMLYGDKASTQVASGTNLLTKAFTFGGGWSVVLKDGSIVTSEDLIRWGDKYGSLFGNTFPAESSVVIPDAAKLKMSQTVLNHMDDLIKHGSYAGEVSRPYIDSNATTLLLNEIMRSATPKLDAYLPSALRWDIAGTFRGASGMWELVVDTATNTVLHFNFIAN